MAPESSLPPGWEVSKCSTTKKICYKHSASGAAQWELPLAPPSLSLPDGWRAACELKDGRIRYEHAETRSLQWEKPSEPPVGWRMPQGWVLSKCSTTHRLCYKHSASGAAQWELPLVPSPAAAVVAAERRPLSPRRLNDEDDCDVSVVAEKTANDVVSARFKRARDDGDVLDLSSQPDGKPHKRFRSRGRSATSVIEVLH